MAPQVRKCPRDGVSLVRESRKARHRTVEIDVCPACGGLFLDKGEIKVLTSHPNLSRLLTKYLDVEADSLLRCPECNETLNSKDVAGLRVDACLECHGVWLDAGELEQLRATDEAEFRRLTHERVDELLTTKGVTRDQQEAAVRAAFYQVSISRRLPGSQAPGQW